MIQFQSQNNAGINYGGGGNQLEMIGGMVWAFEDYYIYAPPLLCIINSLFTQL